MQVPDKTKKCSTSLVIKEMKKKMKKKRNEYFKNCYFFTHQISRDLKTDNTQCPEGVTPILMWKCRSLQPFRKSLILKCKYLDLLVPLLGIIPQKINRGTGKDFRPQIHPVQY